LVSGHRASEIELNEAVAILEDPAANVMFPLTVAAWGHRP
jgi:hypothetical protein